MHFAALGEKYPKEIVSSITKLSRETHRHSSDFEPGKNKELSTYK
jgi:hypothetical protein